ncbi:hypothetical protein Tco_1040327 [Tanacetum coccineum]
MEVRNVKSKHFALVLKDHNVSLGADSIQEDGDSDAQREGYLKCCSQETTTDVGSYTWTMVKCNQQQGNSDSGYYAMRWMYDFANTHQLHFPTTMPWTCRPQLVEKDIDLRLNVVVTAEDTATSAPTQFSLS